MPGKDASYNEPIKRQARGDVLRHAVEALAAGRASSPLVTDEEFDRLLDYCVNFIREHGRQDLSEAVVPLREIWHAMHQSRVGNRAPADLKVLFLSGPDPLNDFEALAELGVEPQNVWAVESDKKTFLSAAMQLREVGAPLKLHWGKLQEFFAVVPEQFDIVYFDACGPLFGGQPRMNQDCRSCSCISGWHPSRRSSRTSRRRRAITKNSGSIGCSHGTPRGFFSRSITRAKNSIA